jgi:hypothetical protein
VNDFLLFADAVHDDLKVSRMQRVPFCVISGFGRVTRLCSGWEVNATAWLIGTPWHRGGAALAGV